MIGLGHKGLFLFPLLVIGAHVTQIQPRDLGKILLEVTGEGFAP